MLLPLSQAQVLRQGEGCGLTYGFFVNAARGRWWGSIHPCSSKTAIKAATRVISFIWNSASVSVADTNG